jgi:PAS domain S-box-containing protein
MDDKVDRDERVRSALAAAGIGVWEWDLHSDAVRWSSTTGLGLNPEEAPTSGRAFFELVHPDDRQALGAATDHAMRYKTDIVAEYRTLASDGAIRWVEAHARVTHDKDGQPLRVLGVNMDISGRKSLEEQLREAQRHAERLGVLKATMRTVQDIVSTALTSLQLFRFEAEPHVSAESLKLFDQIIRETAAKLKTLGDLENVAETDMAMGKGIDYPRSPPQKDLEKGGA